MALQNNFPLSCLNFVRAQGLINPSPAGSDQDRLVFKMLVTHEGQHTRHTAEEQDSGHGVLWVHPCWRPQGSSASCSTQRGQEATGLWYHPAACHNIFQQRHQRSQGEPLHTTSPQRMYVCAQLVHRNCSGGNQDESQTDLETEKSPNRQLLAFLFCSVHFIGNFLYLAH